MDRSSAVVYIRSGRIGGYERGLARIGGKPMIEYVLDALPDEVDDLVIAVENGGNAEAYSEVADKYFAQIIPSGKLNEGARKLYWEYIKKTFFDIGFDGWWLDATEPETGKGWASFYTPFHSTKTAMGSGARFLNAYSLMTTKAVYEGQRSTSNKRVVILTRSSFIGQQRYSAVTWSGDIFHDWGTLREQISAGLNFSISGVPYWTTDIGGFFSGDPATESYREIFTRWFQWGAFCPIFRVHGTNYAKEPWMFGSEVEKILTKYIKLRYRLLPYIYIPWHGKLHMKAIL